MAKKVLSILLGTLMINLVCATRLSAAAPQGEKKVSCAEAVKAAVARLGTGPETHVEVNLGNHVIVKGYISEAREDGFVVVDPKRGVTIKVPYSDVKGIRGNNANTGTKVSVSCGKPSASRLMLIGGLAAIVVVLAVAVHASGQH